MVSRYPSALRKEPEDALPALSVNHLGITELQTSLGGALQESLQSPVWVWSPPGRREEKGEEESPTQTYWRQGGEPGGQLTYPHPLLPVAAQRPLHDLCVSQEHR